MFKARQTQEEGNKNHVRAAAAWAARERLVDSDEDGSTGIGELPGLTDDGRGDTDAAGFQWVDRDDSTGAEAEAEAAETIDYEDVD